MLASTGTFTALHELLVGGQVVGGFGKDAVGAGFHALDGALNRGVHAVHLDGVGAGDQEEVRVGLGIGGGLDTVHHLFGGHDFLAGTMAAALGAHLVFDVAGGGAGLDQALDGALDVEGAGAKAGVDVDQQRQCRTHR
jgi:hypothetical protein